MVDSPGYLVLEIPEARSLSVGECVTFQFRREGFVEQGFVLRLADSYVAYANSCPHWNVDLDLGDARFYDPKIDRIYCKNHGATFAPEDGLCDGGPCLGRRLEAFVVKQVGDQLYVEVPDAAPP